tara:strand:+ start:261 stop:779 length:519 start_codon:yes stop_codon:yes gene_type:complete
MLNIYYIKRNQREYVGQLNDGIFMTMKKALEQKAIMLGWDKVIAEPCAMDAITDEELSVYVSHVMDWESMFEFLPRLARMSKQEVADNVRGVIDMLEKEEESRRARYPFEEGDDYWTIENGRVVWSCWDWVSEQMHDENPNQVYYKSLVDAKDALHGSYFNLHLKSKSRKEK